MRPGITGLWQVEARDNPSFRVYRHLDLFYLENWTLTLDLAILVATIELLMGAPSPVPSTTLWDGTVRTDEDVRGAAPRPDVECAGPRRGTRRCRSCRSPGA